MHETTFESQQRLTIHVSSISGWPASPLLLLLLVLTLLKRRGSRSSAVPPEPPAVSCPAALR
jgi:hypothetical protein